MRAGKDESRPDTGLRERKKRLQRLELLEIAARLFRRDGYDATRMEDIAAAAGVSTKTVYNYFPTKQSLLASFLKEDRQKMIAAYERVLVSPPQALPEAIAAMIFADVGDVVTPEDKKLWRELLAAELRFNDQPDDAFLSNRRVFLDHIELLLESFKREGRISAEISLDVAAELIYAMYHFSFRTFCSDADMRTEDFHLKIATGAHCLTRSWT